MENNIDKRENIYKWIVVYFWIFLFYLMSGLLRLAASAALLNEIHHISISFYRINKMHIILPFIALSTIMIYIYMHKTNNVIKLLLFVLPSIVSLHDIFAYPLKSYMDEFLFTEALCRIILFNVIFIPIIYSVYIICDKIIKCRYGIRRK